MLWAGMPVNAFPLVSEYYWCGGICALLELKGTYYFLFTSFCHVH